MGPGPVWMGGKSRPHRDSIPDRPARSQSLYRLSYPAHGLHVNSQKYKCILCFIGYWGKRTNEEVRQLYGELDIVTEIEKGRLRWLGYVERMSEERVVKRLYQNMPEGSRSVERPRLRWMDDVREDLRRMGVTNWRIHAHRRDY